MQSCSLRRLTTGLSSGLYMFACYHHQPLGITLEPPLQLDSEELPGHVSSGWQPARLSFDPQSVRPASWGFRVLGWRGIGLRTSEPLGLCGGRVSRLGVLGACCWPGPSSANCLPLPRPSYIDAWHLRMYSCMQNALSCVATRARTKNFSGTRHAGSVAGWTHELRRLLVIVAINEVKIFW